MADSHTVFPKAQRREQKRIFFDQGSVCEAAVVDVIHPGMEAEAGATVGGYRVDEVRGRLIPA